MAKDVFVVALRRQEKSPIKLLSSPEPPRSIGHRLRNHAWHSMCGVILCMCSKVWRDNQFTTIIQLARSKKNVLKIKILVRPRLRLSARRSEGKKTVY